MIINGNGSNDKKDDNNDDDDDDDNGDDDGDDDDDDNDLDQINQAVNKKVFNLYRANVSQTFLPVTFSMRGNHGSCSSANLI